MLEYRAEKDLLIAELGTAKSISDESRRRAEEANLAKSRFLATMSHELRTPLNAILGFSEIMMNEVLGPMENATYREYVGDIHSSGQHLLNLINEILDLSRIEAGRYELNEEPVNLVGVVEECHRLLQLRARNKNITIVDQFETGMPRLWADERAVRQVILNLLSNAIKFTPSGGEIVLKVGWTPSGGQYVSVRDNGPGIPPEEIPIVLSTFGQGSIAIKSAEQGAGLGLPIVQALMRMHDGSFELTSKLREGTEAIASFPRARVMRGAAAARRPGRRAAALAARQGEPQLAAGRLIFSTSPGRSNVPAIGRRKSELGLEQFRPWSDRWDCRRYLRSRSCFRRRPPPRTAFGSASRGSDERCRSSRAAGSIAAASSGSRRRKPSTTRTRDAAKRGRPLVGVQLMYGMVADRRRLQRRKLYDYASGKTYSGKLLATGIRSSSPARLRRTDLQVQPGRCN